jgi:hypothetical protein
MHTAVWQEILKEKDHLVEQGVYGRKILILMLNTTKGVNWIYLAEASDKWCALFEHGKEFLGSTKCEELRD